MTFLDPVYDVNFNIEFNIPVVVTCMYNSFELKIENKSLKCFVTLYSVTSHTDYGTVKQSHAATTAEIKEIRVYKCRGSRLRCNHRKGMYTVVKVYLL